MKFYNEEKILKAKNILTVVSLALLSILLFFKVYDYFAKPINLVISTIFPFILSFVIVYALMPIIDMISEKPEIDNGTEKKKKTSKTDGGKFKLNRTLAIFIVLVSFFALFIYIILTIIPLVSEQLSGLIEFFLKNQDMLQRNLVSFLNENNIDLKDTIINSKDAIIENTLRILSSSFSMLSSTFSLLFMTPVFTIMLIFSFDRLENGIEKQMDKWNLTKEKELIKAIDHSVGDYTKVTLLDSLIVGILSYIIFNFLKLDYSLLFSMIVGMGNVIPFIGPFIGLIPVILYASTQSFKLVLFIVVFITIVQTIEANIIKPYLTSKSMNIHPITTLLVVLIGGGLFGIGGAFIAIPVYTVIKLIIIFYTDKSQKFIKL